MTFQYSFMQTLVPNNYIQYIHMLKMDFLKGWFHRSHPNLFVEGGTFNHDIIPVLGIDYNYYFCPCLYIVSINQTTNVLHLRSKNQNKTIQGSVLFLLPLSFRTALSLECHTFPLTFSQRVWTDGWLLTVSFVNVLLGVIYYLLLTIVEYTTIYIRTVQLNLK